MTFLEQYFGPGNGIAWATLQATGSSWRKALDPFLPLVERGAELALLPRVVQEAGGAQTVRWYLLCRTDAARRRALELVGAFLGPSFLQVSGPPNDLDPTDPVDAVVAQSIGPRSFWVAVPKGLPTDMGGGASPAEAVRARLQLLVRLLDEKPVRSIQSHRPVGRILRDFEFAATASNATTATACLDELDAAGYLTAANRQFLGARLDAMRGDWKKLADPGRVEELLALRPPRQIVQLLIEAVYESHLRQMDEAAQASELLSKFKGLNPNYRALLRSHRGVSGHAVDLCFILEAVAHSDRPAAAASESLARVPASAPGRASLEAIARLAPGPQAQQAGALTTSEATALHKAAVAFTLGSIDEAFALASGAPEALERTALLLQIASEARTIETLAVARLSLMSATAEELIQLRRLRRTGDAIELLGELERQPSDTPGAKTGRALPTSWTEWLARIEEAKPWAYAVKAAHELGPQWNLAAELADADAMDAFVSLLEATRSDWGQAAFRDAAPILARELSRLGLGSELRKIHQVLILLFGTDPDGSVPQWAAMAETIEAQLGYSLTAKEYATNLELLGEQLVALKALSLISPALGFLEALCDASCPEPAARLQFVVQLQGCINQRHDQIGRSVQTMFADLAKIAGMPVGESEPEPVAGESELAWFAGRKVALYSLNTATLARAKTALEAEVPTIEVLMCSDKKGGSPGLREIARSADLFVICTADATHSATTYIEQERGTKPRRRVHRKGAVALVAQVREAAIALGQGLMAT